MLDDSRSTSITIRDFQSLIRTMYVAKDRARGVDGTFMWLMEEMGELASALRDGTHEDDRKRGGSRSNRSDYFQIWNRMSWMWTTCLHMFG